MMVKAVLEWASDKLSFPVWRVVSDRKTHCHHYSLSLFLTALSSRVWNENGMSPQTKVKLFNSIVISALAYGIEFWKGLKDKEKRLSRFKAGS